jgi:threonine 3-dehydrogenase
MATERILITGANGQIGSVLTQALRERYGTDHVVASDIRQPAEAAGPFFTLDVLDGEAMAALIKRESITQVYHLAAILSAKGEEAPLHTWEINMQGLFNVLEVARTHQLHKVFYPSSIAVFGSRTEKSLTPQWAHLYPETVYGISKAAGEYWALYYHTRYGLDVRSVRYPGIIGYQSLPGGGTTDYAVDIFHKAIEGQTFSCFLKATTALPMLYMDDAIRGTLELMEAPASQLTVRSSYNLAGMSFTPAELAASIQEFIPAFSISYQPDFRQQIADSWPASIDDSEARADWGWEPSFDLRAMTKDMLHHLRQRRSASDTAAL